MSITSHPEQSESGGQLGKVKSDAKPYSNADTQIKAEHWNAAMSRLIEVHTEVGKTDGSEPGTHAARIKAIENAVNTGGNRASGVSDFDDAASGGGWIAIRDRGDCQVASTLGGQGFGSSGVVVLSVNTGGDFKESLMLVRPATGLNCDGTAPPQVAFRAWTPHTVVDGAIAPDLSHCMFYVGAGGGTFTDDGPACLVALVCQSGSWALATMRTGDTEPTLDTIESFPAGETIQVRITIGVAAWTCEVSTDDGASYATVGSSSIAPTQTTYVPLALLQNDGPGTSHGPRFGALDWCAWSAVRDASSPGSFDGEHALAFPPQIMFGGDGDVQPVGDSNHGGSSDRFARADHVHQGTSSEVSESAVRTALGAAGGEVSVNSQKVTNQADPTNPQDGATKGYVDGLVPVQSEYTPTFTLETSFPDVVVTAPTAWRVTRLGDWLTVEGVLHVDTTSSVVAATGPVAHCTLPSGGATAAQLGGGPMVVLGGYDFGDVFPTGNIQVDPALFSGDAASIVFHHSGVSASFGGADFAVSFTYKRAV